MPDPSPSSLPPPRPRPSSGELFLTLARLGLTSFGGGVSGLLHAEFVRRRRWIDEDEFIAGLSVSQALPGVNVANLAIWLGYRCQGLAGAIVGLGAVVVPPAILIVLIGSLILQLSANPAVGTFLAGIAAAAIGLSLSVGLRAARHAMRHVVPIVIFVLTLVGSLVLHLSAPVLVATFGPIGIALAWRRYSREQG
ncbi:chromate transporter [Aurantimonas sp. MSK8Z-1]|uniref:chromate transporter n=1 Tax=Mangrovibrevibacter kandeliae TaxID=2968473 RepID=UPI00211832ED|nr:chromate transporter [Aurantimonas sp. MSK8Z-1]MCW4113984.1 chromate transporter [Aurantimonas sp. MSK8Z-1]